MTSQELSPLAEDERILNRLLARARIIAKMPGLKKELAGNPEAVAAVMIGLESQHLPSTPHNINNAFDWIDGRAEYTTQTLIGLAAAAGYHLTPTERTPDRAIARIEKLGRPPVEIEYTLDDARRAHRLDEWVERWVKVRGDDGRDRNRLERFVIGADGRRRRTVLDGEETPVDFPEWVTERIRAGEVKRYDSWWNYRTDMLWKSAAKRAIKIACPHVLLGVIDEDGPGAQAVWQQPEADDVDVVDVSEVLEITPGSPYPTADPTPLEDRGAGDPGASVRRPASPVSPFEGEAEPAQTRSPIAPQEGSAPAGQQPLYSPDEEPF